MKNLGETIPTVNGWCLSGSMANIVPPPACIPGGSAQGSVCLGGGQPQGTGCGTGNTPLNFGCRDGQLATFGCYPGSVPT